MTFLERTIRAFDRRALAQSVECKVAEPMDLGSDYLSSEAGPITSIDSFKEFSSASRERSGTFFQERPLVNEPITLPFSFLSDIDTGDDRNNRVSPLVFRAPKSRRALIILHHWNGNPADYSLFAQLARVLGATAVLMPLPYHGSRGTGKRVVNEMVSANLGRTVQSFRQAVIDCRKVVSWLWSNGVSRIGVVGVSLGSAIATLAAAHDDRIHALVTILPVYDTARVVWEGSATRHIRDGLKDSMGLLDLAECWQVISPHSYFPALRAVPTLELVGKFDDVAPTSQADELHVALAKSGVSHEFALLACGHHSLSLPWAAAEGLLRTMRFCGRYL